MVTVAAGGLALERRRNTEIDRAAAAVWRSSHATPSTLLVTTGRGWDPVPVYPTIRRRSALGLGVNAAVV
jgi:hypothetical protein